MPAILEQTLSEPERRAVFDFARRLHAHFGPALERVALFGSRARGDVTEDSDIDIVVVLRVPDESQTEAIRKVWQLLDEAKQAHDRTAVISPVVFSEAHFTELRDRERRFALDVEAEGIRL